MTGRLESLRRHLRRLLERPDRELTRIQRFARDLVLFARHVVRRMDEDRASQLAAALTFRTIFSLIPVLVVALVVLNAFYGPEAITQPLHRMLDFLGLGAIDLDPQFVGPPAPGGPGDAPTVAEWIEQLVLRIRGLNFAAIGAVGVGVLVYAAFSLLFEIERAFNIAYSAPRGRRWLSRLTNYWTVLTLGPLGLILGFLAGERLGMAVEDRSTLVRFLSHAVTLAISWFVLVVAYLTMPNTRVRIRPAAVGAIVGALLWEVGKWGFGLYIDLSAGYARFYGSLGLIPVFLLWVYITWVIVLFGLEISYSLQSMRSIREAHRRQKRPAGLIIDPAVVVLVMRSVADHFAEGKLATARDLSTVTHVPEDAVDCMLTRLIEGGLVRRVDDGDLISGYTLARPPETITVADLLETGRRMAIDPADAAAWRVLEPIQEAQTRAAEGMTLASLSTSNGAPADSMTP